MRPDWSRQSSAADEQAQPGRRLFLEDPQSSARFLEEVIDERVLSFSGSEGLRELEQYFFSLMINGPVLMKDVLTLLLSHQPASELEPVLELWREFEPTSQILLVYGGKEPAFAEVAFPKKVFVDDPQLRVRD